MKTSAVMRISPNGDDRNSETEVLSCDRNLTVLCLVQISKIHQAKKSAPHKVKERREERTHGEFESSIEERDKTGEELDGVIGDLFSLILCEREAFWFIGFFIARNV